MRSRIPKLHSVTKIYTKEMKKKRPDHWHFESIRAWGTSRGISINPDGDFRREFLAFARKAGIIDIDSDDLGTALKRSRDTFLASTQAIRLLGPQLFGIAPPPDIEPRVTLAELLELTDMRKVR